MSFQNIPPPPQYPNYPNVDIIESNLSKENSIMENSVIYISDGGSPNYKTNRKNGYPYSTNHILPHLVNSINCTYQNLPPKSPKSNYRNVLNNGDIAQRNNQLRNGEPLIEPITQQYKPIPNMAFNKQNQQYWMVKPQGDLVENNGFRDWSQNTNVVTASKTRSHPNLVNDYVNLAGTEAILNDIMCNRNGRPFIPTTNDSNKNCMSKPHQIPSDQFSTVIGPAPPTPEMFRNGFQMYPPQGLAEYGANPDNFSTESSRLVNLLLEENKRLRSKLHQSDSRLESVDQLERKIHNLEILFEELLTSQRRQRLLDLQLQQVSLTNYLAKNVSQNDVVSPTTGPGSTTPSDHNRPIDLRKTNVNCSQTIIPSSPIITQKLSKDSPGERSLGFGTKQSKNDVTKVYFDQQERYLAESEGVDAWPEPGQDHRDANVRPAHLQKRAGGSGGEEEDEDDLCQQLKKTIRSVNMATSPYLGRTATDNGVSIVNSSPTDVLNCKVLATSSAARNWLAAHQSWSPSSVRLRMAHHHHQQQPQHPVVTCNGTVNITSVSNLNCS